MLIYIKNIPITKAETSKTKYELKKLGVVGSKEKSILPRAIEPTRNVMNLIAKIPKSLLKIPIKHKIPIHRFKPPYIPAISE